MTIEAAPAVRPERFDLGDGLIMRWSTSADKDDLGELMGESFRYRPLNRSIPKGYEPHPHDFIRAGARRVMSGHSAVMDPTDFAVVENTKAKEGEPRLVAGMSLQRLPGYYGKTDLQFGVGELVGALPKYRNRGLIRRLFFDMIHPASDARGDVIQVIPGISYFYLQFGYIHAIKAREIFILPNLQTAIPKLAEGQQERFTLRKPTRADLPYLLQMSTRQAQGSPADLGFHYDASYWLYTSFEVPENAESYHDGDRMARIIVDNHRRQARSNDEKDAVDNNNNDDAVGLVIFSAGNGFAWELFTLNEAAADGITYREVMYPVLRQILAEAHQQWNSPLAKLRQDLAKELEADEQRRKASADPKVKFAPVLHPLLEYGEDRIGDRLLVMLHPTHPVRQLLAMHKPAGQVYPGFRMYTRIRSYPKFLTKVAPTLEHRLANSPMAGLTATLLVHFYRATEGASASGLKMRFVRGRLVAAEDWAQPLDEVQVELDRLEVLAAEKKKQDDDEKEKKNEENNKAAPQVNGQSDEANDANGCEAKEEEKQDVKPVEYKAMFPPLVFTRLVVGEASFEQLKVAYEDAYAVGDECKMLLRILFPVIDHNTDNFWW